MKTPDGAVALDGRVIARFWRGTLGKEGTLSYGFHFPAGIEPWNIPHGTEVVPAASLDALRGELSEARFRIEQLDALTARINARANAAEAKLAAVGALAEQIAIYAGDEDGSRLDRLAAHWSTQLRTLIAEAGTGEGGNG